MSLYSIANDGFECCFVFFFLDVDECSSQTLNICDHLCANTIGSYNCSCNDGYRLSSNGFTCYGIVMK